MRGEVENQKQGIEEKKKDVMDVKQNQIETGPKQINA